MRVSFALPLSHGQVNPPCFIRVLMLFIDFIGFIIEYFRAAVPAAINFKKQESHFDIFKCAPAYKRIILAVAGNANQPWFSVDFNERKGVLKP